MDTQQTKRSNKDIAIVDPEAIVQLNTSFKTLGPELLTQVFNWIQDSYKDRKLRNAQLAKLRVVCAHWRNVIDENLFFEPAISDNVVNGNYPPLLNMKVRKCAVASLTYTPKPEKIPKFLDPTWLKEVSFGEVVTRDAFLAMCEHFNKFCKITSVEISHGLKYCPGEEIALEPDEVTIINEFWGNVEKLELNVPFLDLGIKAWGDDQSLLGILRKAELPRLKHFKITGHWRLLMSPFPINFLSRHHSSLESIHVQMEPYLSRLDYQSFLHQPETMPQFETMYWEIPLKVGIAELENIQIKNLIVEGSALSHIAKFGWMTVISAQKKLEQLKLSHICQSAPMEKAVPGPLSLDDLIPVLEINMSTLTHLELFEFQFNDQVDCKLFQALGVLGTLKLSKNSNELLSSIVNMDCLPGSLKKLSISGIACSDMELQQFAKAAHLNKLSSLKLVSIEYLTCNQPKEIPEEILKDLRGMKSIVFVYLDGQCVIQLNRHA